MKHVLVEIFCFKDQEEPKFCEGIGYMCIHNNCQYMGCTYCPNEIAYVGTKGVVESYEDSIGFGGDMVSKEENANDEQRLKNEWETICKRKINEAYYEYMKYKNKQNDL